MGGSRSAAPAWPARWSRIYAVTGHVGDALGYAYGHTGNFHDVTSGTNGSCSGSPSYFCNGVAGFDGPTGVGTPDGNAMVGGGTTRTFTVALNPTTGSGAPGDTVSYTVQTTALSSSAPNVALSVSGLPAGVTGSFSKATVTAGGTTTLSLSLGTGAAAATTSFTLTGSAGSETHSASGSITVTGSGSGGGGVGGSTTLQNGVAVTGLAGATGAQTSFTMDVPSGATNLQFAITGGTGDANLYVKFGSAPTLSSYDCRPYVTGNAETCTISNVQTGTYYVMLNAYAAYAGVSLTGSYAGGTGTGGGGGGSGNFSLTLSTTTVSVAQGASQQITVHTALTSSTPATVTFHVTGLPTGVTAAFSQATVTAGRDTTLTVSADASAPAVSADSFRVYGSSGSHTHYRTAYVTVTAGSGGGSGGGATGDFAMTLSTTSVSLSQGAARTLTVHTTDASGAGGTIDFHVTGLPSGVSASFSSTSVTAGGNTVLTLTASSSATPVTADSFRVYGQSGTWLHYRGGSLTVTTGSGGGGGTGSSAGDFSLTLGTTSLTIARGHSATFTVDTATVGSASPTVALHIPTLPAGVTATFSPASLTAGGSSTVTLTVSSTAATTSATSFRVYGQSSDHTHYRTAHLTVQ